MISLVLCNWKRPGNLPAIIDVFRPLASEIIIWNNAPEPIAIDGATVIQSERNMMLRGRWEAAVRAKHENVMTIDDDFLPEVSDLKTIIDSYLADDSKVWACIRRTHRNRTYPLLLGWGSIFHRRHLASLNSFVEVHGWSELLEREADRIFSILAGKEYCRWILAKGRNLWGHHQEMAICRHPNHEHFVADAVALAERFRHQTITGGGGCAIRVPE